MRHPDPAVRSAGRGPAVPGEARPGPGPRFLVEWGVWLAAVQPRSPHHGGCRALVSSLLAGRRPGEAAVTDLALARLAAELERQKPPRPHAEVGRYLEAASSSVQVVSVTPAQLRAAAVLSGLLELEYHACCTMKVALDLGVPLVYATRPPARKVSGLEFAPPGAG